MAVRPVSFIVQTTITKERQHTLTRCALTVRSVQVLDLVYNYFRPCPGCVEAVLSPPRRKPSRKERRIASRTAVWTSLWNWQRWQIWLRLPRATPSHPFSFVSMVSQADKGRHCENNIEPFTFHQIFRFEIPGIACGEWNSISQLVGLTRPRSSDVSGEDDDVTFYQWSKLLHA